MGAIDSEVDWLWVLVIITVETLLCRNWPCRARITWAWLWCLLSLLFGCKCDYVVLWCGLKLFTGCISFGSSSWGRWYKPTTAAACALPMATWYELDSDLQMVTTCAVFGGAWERLAGNWGQLPLVPVLGLLSKRYNSCWGQKLIVWGLWNFEYL